MEEQQQAMLVANLWHKMWALAKLRWFLGHLDDFGRMKMSGNGLFKMLK